VSFALKALLMTVVALQISAPDGMSKQSTQSFDKVMEQARLFKRTRQNALAFEAYSKALKMRPKNSEAHASMGWILFEMKMVDEAVAEEERAIELDPRNALAHHHLAVINMSLGRYPEAADEFRAEYSIDPRRNCNCGPAFAIMLQYPPGYTDMMKIRAKAEYDREQAEKQKAAGKKSTSSVKQQQSKPLLEQRKNAPVVPKH
jgi:tetratricopeptide (TPR) repeat protein